MTFGQQPQNGNPYYGGNQQYNNVNQQYNNNGQYQQQYQQAPYGGQQYAYATANGPAVMDAQATYSYDQVQQARRVSVTRAYGEMTLGLIVTALVAVLGQNAYYDFLMATGNVGLIGLCIVQVGLAVVLGARIMQMKASTARIMFYVYAALMGFTLSSIFWLFAPQAIGVSLGLCAAFFFVLTMFSLTTKFDMLKLGPILMVGLIVLIIAQLVLFFVPGTTETTRIICAIGLVLFAGMTMYDAQQTRMLFQQYEAQGPEMIKKVSIICALNLYLDFVNMFLYILQLFGSRD
ncbi:Bax inhibitor-1/YccA family protein [Bifidobacterium leontopitheci]|uniref:Inhibitor of apoptosis-promoting Bax1 n=1 Tax=Bifidobacterium leontopitheci TaxID=2650774 RepID=A0A6I1GPG7_9BIFI|nr:Bax inhibitor-1/YccA family protein [Bifidobacterium leontopitheci]KAB7791177.1 Inhibitor of apoptosis-promoting Bax1 [Bifidobacterium leontopitheci]